MSEEGKIKLAIHINDLIKVESLINAGEDVNIKDI